MSKPVLEREPRELAAASAMSPGLYVRPTRAATAAVEQSVHVLRAALGTL